jgi:predicted 3-demethylubiquinone-9 3-methyltransferase (glyoxalase superfamily)
MASKISPFMWFVGNAEEAVGVYTSLFPNSRITDQQIYPEGVPGNMEGQVMTISFELDGLPYTALNGPAGVFDAPGPVSFEIRCDDQAEVDRYWDALLEGGKAQQCGWLTDRFGITWQVVPQRLIDLLADPDAEASHRVMQAMLGMVKIDIAGLEKAYAG